MRKKILNKLIRDEKGQALILVLILILLGSLIITPLLSHMSTGLKVGKEVYEEKMYRLYAADSGVEDALWQIKNDKLSSKLAGYDEYNYGNPYPYPDSLVVNDKNVGVSVENVWVPKIAAPSSVSEALYIAKYGNTIGESQVAPRLIITGNPSQTNPATQYQIGINYYYGSEGTNVLKVQNIGIWLPAGFHYVSGSSNLTGASESNTPYKGGEAVVWAFSSPPMFKNLPGIPTTPPLPNPMVSIITFSFTGPAGQTPSCVSWIKTSGVSSIPYAWDADKKVYGINSVAKDNPDTGKNVTVDAYALKTEPRQMGSATSGDYVAIGNSLMVPNPNDSSSDRQNFRGRLLKESSAAIDSYSGTGEVPLGKIPADATVKAAYLYWSGFIDHYYWYWHTRMGLGDPYVSGWYFSSDSNNNTGTVYNANNLPGLIANAKVNTVSFGVSGAMQPITATQWQVCLKTNDSPNCWYYTCLYDATAQVKTPIENAIKTGGSGTCTFTLGHVSGVINQTPPRNITIDFPRTPSAPSSDHTSGYSFYLYNSSGSTVGYTGYPLGTPATKLPEDPSYNPNKQIPATANTQNRYNASYAGWSLVIIYSTPGTQGHQLYLYDIKNPNFKFKESYQSDMDFDGDGNAGGKISGFLVPQPITGEVNAAKITCFVGEGDDNKPNDFIAFNAPSQYWSYPASLNIPNTYKLWDGKYSVDSPGTNTPTSPNNVWNSMSLGASASGVDIDTFYIPWGNPVSSGLLKPGDTWTQINLPSPGDGVTLSYIILSFRSLITYGGTISYLVSG